MNIMSYGQLLDAKDLIQQLVIEAVNASQMVTQFAIKYHMMVILHLLTITIMYLVVWAALPMTCLHHKTVVR